MPGTSRYASADALSSDSAASWKSGSRTLHHQRISSRSLRMCLPFTDTESGNRYWFWALAKRDIETLETSGRRYKCSSIRCFRNVLVITLTVDSRCGPSDDPETFFGTKEA